MKWHTASKALKKPKLPGFEAKTVESGRPEFFKATTSTN
jgi:hypothetical protein